MLAVLGLGAGVAQAEVCPAYDASKKVELDGSPLEAAIYDGDSRCLVLFFSDLSIYAYAMVPESVYRGLLDARWPGWYFNDAIRPAFEFERLPVGSRR